MYLNILTTLIIAHAIGNLTSVNTSLTAPTLYIIGFVKLVEKNLILQKFYSTNIETVRYEYGKNTYLWHNTASLGNVNKRVVIHHIFLVT